MIEKSITLSETQFAFDRQWCMESPEKIELPSAFEDADVDHLVVLIADMLDRLIEHNDRIPLSP